MPSISRLSVALLMVAGITSPVYAQSAVPRHARVALPEQARAELTLKERINASTIGLAAGRTEGAPLQFAAELARVLDDGDNMRVLPIVTRGPFDNIYDLLYLRGVDAAIVYGDVLDHFRSKPEFAAAVGTRFGVIVQSQGTTPAQIVVERSTYSNSSTGEVWAAGATALATKLQ